MLFSEMFSTKLFHLLRYCQIRPILHGSMVGNAGEDILAIVWLQTTMQSKFLAQLR